METAVSEWLVNPTTFIKYASTSLRILLALLAPGGSWIAHSVVKSVYIENVFVCVKRAEILGCQIREYKDGWIDGGTLDAESRFTYCCKRTTY